MGVSAEFQQGSTDLPGFEDTKMPGQDCFLSKKSILHKKEL